jgi:hypothetical protein
MAKTKKSSAPMLTQIQTRANAELRDTQKLVARAKPRASVIEADYDAHINAPTAPASAPAPVATPTPAPATPSVIVPAPSNCVVNGSNGSIAYVNGSNGSLNGASNGAASL